MRNLLLVGLVMLMAIGLCAEVENSIYAGGQVAEIDGKIEFEGGKLFVTKEFPIKDRFYQDGNHFVYRTLAFQAGYNKIEESLTIGIGGEVAWLGICSDVLPGYLYMSILGGYHEKQEQLQVNWSAGFEMMFAGEYYYLSQYTRYDHRSRKIKTSFGLGIRILNFD